MGEMLWQLCDIPWDRLTHKHGIGDLGKKDKRTVKEVLPMIRGLIPHWSYGFEGEIESNYDSMVRNLGSGELSYARGYANRLMHYGRKIGVEFIICSPINLGRNSINANNRTPVGESLCTA